MKRLLIASIASCIALSMQAQKIVRISTDNTDLVYQVNEHNRIYQVYLGDTRS